MVDDADEDQIFNSITDFKKVSFFFSQISIFFFILIQTIGVDGVFKHQFFYA